MLHATSGSAAPHSAAAEAYAIARLLPRAIGERLRLAGLELRRARRALVGAAALGAAALLMIVTAWHALWFAVAFGPRAAELSWPAVAGVISAINLVGAAAAAALIRHSLASVDLPATRRHLGLAHPPDAAKRPDGERSAEWLP